MRWITKIDCCPRKVNHAAALVNNTIYSFGGYSSDDPDPENASMDVHFLNTISLRWARHPVSDTNQDVAPRKLYGHTAVAYNERIYVWGGRYNEKSSPQLFCFDTTTQNWIGVNVSGNIPSGRDGHTACLWKNRMYLFGGFEDDSESFATSLHCVDLDAHHWMEIRTEGPSPPVRDFHTAVCIKDKMYIFGGRGTNLSDSMYSPTEEVYYDDIWCLDFQTNTWKEIKVKGCRPESRRSHSAFVYKDRMYIFGGFNEQLGRHFNDVWEYDVEKNDWTQVQTLGDRPCERRRQVCILANERLFLFGGTSPPGIGEGSLEDGTTIDQNDMHILDVNINLKVLAMIYVKRYKLDISPLPNSLRQVEPK